MVRRARDVASPVVPPLPAFDTPARRTALARERFFERGERPTGLVPESVVDSWLHCLRLGRRPHQPACLDPVSRGRRGQVLARNHALLDAARAELHQLDDCLSGTPVKALLTDRRGVVVHATPARDHDGPLLRAACVGRDLGEALLGTTAPGITARTGRACTVLGGEHFLDEVQVMHCAAAPIRDARGRLAGVLDLSIEGQPFAFDAAALVRMTAIAIENRLLVLQSQRLRVVGFQGRPPLLGTPLEGLAALADDGTVAWVNRAGLNLLLPPGAQAQAMTAESLFGMTAPALFDVLRRGAPQALRVPARNGLRLWVGVHAVEPAGTESEAPPTLLSAPAEPPARSLKDASRQVIEDALAQHGGNVAKTARALGVSRGLLYRRMAPSRG
jgi:transcriptional regulator of acetoin/glycerol metabolism